MCDPCLDRLPPIAEPRCSACGRALGRRSRPRLCSQCRASPPPLDHARAYGVYAGYLQGLIHALKFRGELRLAQGLGELMAWIVAADGRYGKIDAVVAVPLHPSRERERGYNQAEALAGVVAAHLGKPLIRPAVRVEATIPQTKLPWEERRRNVRRAFAVSSPSEVTGRRLLLVDDVYTTGSTLAALALTLKRAGCRRCVSVCAAASSLDVEFSGGASPGGPDPHFKGGEREERKRK